MSPYSATSVKFELGARSDHFPVKDATVTPYAQEAFSEVFSDAKTHVRVLLPIRTFWEKVTILHMLHHQPKSRKIGPQMSRHYYDVYRMARTSVLDQALAATDLLQRVAFFKSVYFRAGWAKIRRGATGHAAAHA